MHASTLIRNCFSDASVEYSNAKSLIIDDMDRELKKLGADQRFGLDELNLAAIDYRDLSINLMIQ